MNVNHYTYRVRWSSEDGEYVATVAEFPSLSWLEADPADAFAGIRRLVQRVVQDMRAEGENLPLPFGERNYSGKFQVRIPPEAHRELAIQAAEQRVSLNQLANKRLLSA